MLRQVALTSALSLVLTAYNSHAQTVLYVDHAATGADDGSSWCNAYVFLQDALAAAAASGGTVNEIRVARGTYKPDQGANQTPGDRTATFQLLNGVSINGGYAGCGAPDPDAQDTLLYETSLSGDLAGDDVPPFQNITDNSDKVVTGNDVDESAALNGLTIVAANSSSEGGGMVNTRASPTLRDVTFARNQASFEGAGLLNIESSSPTLIDCTFIENRTTTFGGGLANFDASHPALTRCAFIDNRSGSRGGAVANIESDPTFVDCSFDGNYAFHGGGGMYNNDSNPVLTGCAFVQNEGSAVFNEDFSNAVFRACSFTENFASGPGGAIRNYISDPILTDCTFVQNRATDSGGALYNDWSRPTIINCLFVRNRSLSGGAVYAKTLSDLTVFNTSFLLNISRGQGGGFSISGQSSVGLTNCSLIGNSARDDGGAIWIVDSDLRMTNCTVVANEAADLGGGVHYRTGVGAMLNNCIFWANVDLKGTGESSQLAGIPPNINFSCVQDWTGAFGGSGNIGDDPLLADPDGADDVFGTVDDNVHLTLGSPCIDAADTTAVPPDIVDIDADGDTLERTPLDLDGDPRFEDDPATVDSGISDPPAYPQAVDMGAYEFPQCGLSAECDDGLFCSGVESCQLGACFGVAPPNCDDGIACTNDTCDEAIDACAFEPDDARCADNVACTDDRCDPIAGCQAMANHSYCDDGMFCNGVETCDLILGCQLGSEPCPPGTCNEAEDVCEELAVPTVSEWGICVLVLLLLTCARIKSRPCRA